MMVISIIIIVTSSSSNSNDSSEVVVVALSEYYVPGCGFSSLHKSYFIFTASLWDSNYYYLQFTGEKMEAEMH